MNRRNLLLVSTVFTTTSLVPYAKAQINIGNISLPLSRERMLSIVSNASSLEAMFVAVDALRLNLILARASTTVPNVNLAELLATYEQKKDQIRSQIERIRTALGDQPEPMPPLTEQLEEIVRRAATQLIEAGIAVGSPLLKALVENFWAFLNVLEKSTSDGAGAIASWLCDSFPFNVLC